MNEARYRITEAGTVFLHLPNRLHGLEIGWLADSGRTFHTKRIPQKHFHLKSRSYGFSYDWIRGGAFHSVVVHLISSGEELHTTRQVILRRGHFLKFRSYERQIFLRLSDFGKARELEVEHEIEEEQTQKGPAGPASTTTQLALFPLKMHSP